MLVLRTVLQKNPKIAWAFNYYHHFFTNFLDSALLKVCCKVSVGLSLDRKLYTVVLGSSHCFLLLLTFLFVKI